MASLYLDHQTLELEIDHDSLIIRRPERKPQSVPLRLLDRIVLVGDLPLTADLLTRLAEQGIPLLLFTGRGRRRHALLHGHPRRDLRRRLIQYRWYDTPERRAAWARQLVTGKLRNQIGLLQAAQAQRPDLRHPLARVLEALDRIAGRLEHETPPDAGLATLRGLEGAAGALYFQGFTQIFPPSLQFTGRNRRPPKDPVNVILSLSYTLIHGDAVHAAQMAGLDPLLGLFHEPAPGHDALASDLMEPLRPHIDRWIWRLFADRRLEADHFTQEAGGCLLGKAGRALFYPQWEERAPALRRLLRLQARALAAQLDHQADRELPQWPDTSDTAI